jgi:hypothetical protein
MAMDALNVRNIISSPQMMRKRGVKTMVKCPHCGSTTNPRLKQIDEQELNCYTIEATRTYECGCGLVFISKEYKNNT